MAARYFNGIPEDEFMLLKGEYIIDYQIDTFITIDTAETDKDYNDATVFSFWGVYKIVQDYIDTGVYGLHCLDCWEVRKVQK